MSGKYSLNLICPCGSGKKYKNCCTNKNFNYIIGDRHIKKKIKYDDEVFEILKKQRQRFIDIYGRKPDPMIGFENVSEINSLDFKHQGNDEDNY